MKIFLVAGIGIAIFIEFLLITKKNKSAPDRILTLWMFLIVVHLFLYYMHLTKDIFDYPFLLGIELPLPLIHGVLLYFYVGFLTNQIPGKTGLLFLHFVPVTMMYLYLVKYFVLPADQKILVYRNQGAGYEMFNIIRSYAISFSGVFYVIWSAMLLRKHRNNIRDQFSNLEKLTLRWLQILTIGMGSIWFLVIFTRNDILVFTGVVVFVFLIGFFGIRQAAIATQDPLLPDDNEQKKKYSKSGLTEESSDELHQALIRLMTEDAVYRKIDLSINDLAARLGVHPNYLSQVINQNEKRHFYDFVNAYRIEEFKRLIAMPGNQNLTLLSVAFNCGFNSKSSFNRYFKKATGQTPSQYFTALTTDQRTTR